MKRDAVAIILAAGEGKRLKSGLVKAVHKVSGVPIVEHVRRAAEGAGVARTVVVVGRNADVVQNTLGDSCQYVEQRERLGTGHACSQAEELLADFSGTVFVLMGDAPLISSITLSRMLTEHRERGALATVLTARPEDVRGLGRIERDEKGHFVRIVEERDASPQQASIREINAGFYCFESRALFEALARIDNNNAQGEYMLTDTLPIVACKGTVHTVEIEDFSEALGINDRVWLSQAEKAMQKRIKEELMMSGVTMIDPDSTYVEADVRIEPDTILFPFTTLQGKTIIGESCRIGPGSTVIDSRIAAHSTVLHSVVVDSDVGSDCHIGPFAHLRPDTLLHEGVKIGNFVEVKKSEVAKGTKISHLSYIGDGQIGQDVNIGAGTIFVNYDGKDKHQTIVEAGSFIGCNSNLVAPVRIGQGAYVAAGSTITRDVPAEALAVARSRQENKEGWVTRKKH